MSNIEFTVIYPSNLTEPILDVFGEELRLSDQTSAEGRRLDVETDDPGNDKRIVYTRLDEDAVRVLRDRLTAWLDAPLIDEAETP